MENKKNKNELITEAQELADKYNEKKSVITTALDDLDSKKVVGQEHIKGMAIIEDMFNELDIIEVEQLEIFNRIKKI